MPSAPGGAPLKVWLAGLGFILAVIRMSYQIRRISARVNGLSERRGEDSNHLNPEVGASPDVPCSGETYDTATPSGRRTRRSALNSEVVCLSIVALGFGLTGFLLLPDTEPPVRFSSQTFSAGISSVPNFIHISEYHGLLPEGYDDNGKWWHLRGDVVGERYDTAASPGTVTFDLHAGFSAGLVDATPVVVTVDIPADAELQLCRGWSSNTPYLQPLPGDYRPVHRSFDRDFICETEETRAGPPTWFVGYGSMRDLADPGQRRVRVEVTAPAGTTGLTYQMRFAVADGIGFSASEEGVATHFPQFTQIATERTSDFSDERRSDEPSIDSTNVLARYWIPGADQANWEGERPESNPTQATWDFKALDVPQSVSATYVGVARRNEEASLAAGLLIGVSGSAILAAVQASYNHRRSRMQ